MPTQNLLGRLVVLLGFWPFLARPPPSVPQALKGPAAARTWQIYGQAAPLGPDVSIGTHFGQVRKLGIRAPELQSDQSAAGAGLIAGLASDFIIMIHA